MVTGTLEQTPQCRNFPSETKDGYTLVPRAARPTNYKTDLDRRYAPSGSKKGEYQTVFRAKKYKIIGRRTGGSVRGSDRVQREKRPTVSLKTNRSRHLSSGTASPVRLNLALPFPPGPSTPRPE